MKHSKIIDALALSPLAVILADSLLPDDYNKLLSFSVIILAAACCMALNFSGLKTSCICMIPALICIISGFDGAYDFVKYGVGTPGELVDKFCYFICGIWCLYFLVKLAEKENKK